MMKYRMKEIVLLVLVVLPEWKHIPMLLGYSIYSKDLECRKTFANATDVMYTGAKSEAEVLGKDDFAFYPKEMAEKFFADDKSVLQTGKALLNREEYVIDENGNKRWLLASKIPLRDKDNKIIGLVGIGRNITERKQAEDAFQESEMHYRNLVEKIPDGVYKSTHDGKFIDANPAMVKMLGYSGKEELFAIDIRSDLYLDRSNYCRAPREAESPPQPHAEREEYIRNATHVDSPVLRA